ncbi:uncharacterized protein N7515_002652 [Penicillium bovifimosum]|uniref:Uncharacterized protein n=1 Tax=Penicillium bovifimosum TaxID=126998 RepID=A0A9W9L897_9EURO|nr:uncharacterized protein N7515_002652 [Penicillium bovifimosum]KAJ5143865.1 hypothetical protein N7515_002652 [Penicillium bovifimosum]
MARPSSPDATHIPVAFNALAPYVKSRQETLQIRQALTHYLRSFIEFDETQSNDLTQSHLSLCTPTDAVAEVKRIPTEVTGLRKEYLQALAANVAARKDLVSASEDVASLRRQRTTRPSADADLQEPGAELREYLALLRDRRRHAKLQVFQNYLEEIKTRDAGGLENIGLEEEHMPLPEVNTKAERNGTETGLDDLVHSLERAVIRARTQLDHQKELFEQAKARHESRGESEVSPDVKAEALQRTRDELVQWVEERLVGQGDPDESLLQELPPEEIEEAQQELEDRKKQIMGQYATYLQARRDLLDAASRACQPVTVAPKPSSRSAKKEFIPAEVPPPNPIDVLSYTDENLIPLSKSQKSLALQTSYLLGLLSKEKSTTLRALNRLSDESHLLPEYPVVARQSRVGARNHTSAPETKPDEVVALAEAWAFASQAAATKERDFVQQKIALGTEVAQDARQTLADVYGTLNQELDEVMPQSQQKRDACVRASGPRSTQGMPGGSQIEKKPTGPWSKLSGSVGVGE